MDKKFVPYIIKGTSVRQKVKDIEFEIRNTKQEESFRGFSLHNSPQNLLCHLASEDPLLSLLFFLKPKIHYQPIEDAPLVLEYPIVIDYDKKFVDLSSKDATKNYIDDKRKRQEESQKDMKDLSSRLLWRIFSIAISDKQVSERIRRKRFRLPQEEMDNIFDSLMKRHRKGIDEVMLDYVGVIGRFYQTLEYYYPLITAFDDLGQAMDNLQTLSSISDLNMPLADALGDSLSKLTAHRIFGIRIESLCMECNLKKGLEPFSMVQKYPEKPILLDRCEKCGGKTIFHRVKMEAPVSFAPLITENRLPEFLIGYELAMSNLIDKVYIHKNVQLVTEKGLEKGQQINILAITKDNKTVVVETSISMDLNKITKDAKKKEEALEKLPYDKIAFVTPTKIDRYTDFGDIRIFGARHILKIRSHIEHLIEEIQ